jgi:mannose-6-phosphate isomerase
VIEERNVDRLFVPVSTSPILLLPNRVWRFYTGGMMIDRFKGEPSVRDTHYPEEWVGSLVQAVNPQPHYKQGEGLQLVTVDRQTVGLKEAIEANPEGMLGGEHVRVYGTDAALLVKLLDASIRLVLHAHPTKEFAKQHLNSCFGKTEAWFILETRPDVEEPCVYDSFKDEVSPRRWRELIDRQDVKEMMRLVHKIPVKPGDVVYVKAGLPHAIGAGVFMVELQEPTDFALIYERECAGFAFEPKDCFMGLDADLALSNTIHRVYSWEEVQRELLIKPKEIRREGKSTEVQLLGYNTTECFAGHRLTVVESLSDDTRDRFCILIVLDGEGVLVHENGELKVRRGHEIFLPAAVGKHLFKTAPEKKMTIMKCLPAAL